MMRNESKIASENLQRKAFVYVRQSSLMQVQMHQESTRRQYALRGRAKSLGWAEEQIEVIDEDLGRSASEVGRIRAGFQRLLSGMVSGEVGAILSVEVSRLARQDSEGYRLVEVAALAGVLLIDEQQVYDPNNSDDRLMLGLKVLLSSNEIRLMNQRLRENKLRKAQRGELRLSLPVGLVQDIQAKVRLDPDERVQGALRLVFERFRISRHLSNVVRYFYENGLLIPHHVGNWDGPIEWRELSLPRARNILTNPLYAGAYVYGRTTRRAVSGTQQNIQRKVRPLDPDTWKAVQWDAFQGYISRAEYETNQAILAANLPPGNILQRGRRKDGSALLSGLVLCGRCGKPMYVYYSRRNKQYVTYVCATRRLHYAQPACQTIPGAQVDRLVMESVLQALNPAQIELSLSLTQEVERQQAELSNQWQRHLEGARYAAHLAQRRYAQVDPDHRLVAHNLEAEWEAALQKVTQMEADFALFSQQKPLQLSPQERQHLVELAQDLPGLWSAPSTSWTERKNLLELLIADVTLTRLAEGIRVQIRWQTNQVDSCLLPLPVIGSPPTPPQIAQRIRDLYQLNTDQQIAKILNQEGLKTACGHTFTTRIIADTRRRIGIHKQPYNPKI